MSIPPDRLERAFGDRFQIERELGQGGMAIVYLAHDVEDNRRVALKVLLPELGSSVAVDRFLKEVEIGGRLSHTHILPLYRSGQADGLLYYTMQYLEGETLRERLDRERQLPIEDALDITREVASALAYAHRQGVVHRDIKPENIMLSEGGAVVMDFGIARALDEAGGDRLTKTGLSMGTPAYMPPEQADGQGRLDGRADLYSLACVLYETLAGHPPFQGSSMQAILSRHARDPVPPLSSARPTVSVPIETVVHKALSKVPADRFRSADKFADALDMAEQGVTPRGVTPFDTRAHRRMSFWEELKRRRVYQVGVTYAIIAFGIWQVLDALPEDVIPIPGQLRAWIIWATILGFPVALLLAWVFELTPSGIRRTQLGIATPSTVEQFTPRQRWLMRVGVLAAVAVALFVGLRIAGWLGAGSSSGRSAEAAVDLASVTTFELESRDFVVLPFRVSGADATVSAAIQELLDGYLHGDMSRREWDVTDVRRAHEQIAPTGGALTQAQALGIAAGLGAGRLVRAGTVVGTADRLTIGATVERVPTGTVLDQAQIEGPASDLPTLAQRLAILLLNHGWEDAISKRELERVAGASRPALEEHLEAVRARWRGENAAALASARQARSLQPDFAAPVFLEWAADPNPEAETRAWEVRDALSERARTAVEVASGGLGPPARPTATEVIDFLERQHLEHPRWEELVDGLTWWQYELGAYAGRRDLGRQLRNLQADDSTLVEGEEGAAGLWTVGTLGWKPDTAGLAERARRLLREAEGGTTDIERFRPFEVAAVLEERGVPLEGVATLEELRRGDIHAVDPALFLRFGLLDARPRDDPLGDFARAIERSRANQITTRDGVWADHFELRFAEARGEISTVTTLADSLSKVAARDVHTDARLGRPAGAGPTGGVGAGPGGRTRGGPAGDPWWYLILPIQHALYEPGWHEAVEWALHELEWRPYAASEHPGFGAIEGECWPALGRLALGRIEEAESHVEPLRSAVEADSLVRGICLAAVEAWIEHQRGAPATAPKLLAFDALMRQAPRETLMGIANLLLARIYEERGETDRALEAVYRRPYRNEVYSSQPGYLRLEGRLAAATGDTARAIERYEHYLLLRESPDPALVPVRDSVRAELDALRADAPQTDG